MTNEEFQRLVLKKLEKLDSLEAGQKNLESRLGSLETGQKNLESRLGSLETGQKNLELKYEEISKKLDSVIEQTAILSEFKEEVFLELDNIKTTISKIEIVTADNWGDIARLKSIK